MAFMNGNVNLAIKKLCSFTVSPPTSLVSAGPAISSTQILIAHKTFKSGIDDELSMERPGAAVAHAECLLLLAYLTAEGDDEPRSTVQGSISAAMSALRDISQSFEACGYHSSASHELILQSGAELLYAHATKG